METCVLIPQELSLMISQPEAHATTRTNHHSPPSFVKSIMAGKQKRYHPLHSPNNVNVTVWTNATLARTTLLHPFQGTIRLDKIDVFNALDDGDVSYSIYFILIMLNRKFNRNMFTVIIRKNENVEFEQVPSDLQDPN